MVKLYFSPEFALVFSKYHDTLISNEDYRSGFESELFLSQEKIDEYLASEVAKKDIPRTGFKFQNSGYISYVDGWEKLREASVIAGVHLLKNEYDALLASQMYSGSQYIQGGIYSLATIACLRFIADLGLIQHFYPKQGEYTITRNKDGDLHVARDYLFSSSRVAGLDFGKIEFHYTLIKEGASFKLVTDQRYECHMVDLIYEQHIYPSIKEKFDSPEPLTQGNLLALAPCFFDKRVQQGLIDKLHDDHANNATNAFEQLRESDPEKANFILGEFDNIRVLQALDNECKKMKSYLLTCLKEKYKQKHLLLINALSNERGKLFHDNFVKYIDQVSEQDFARAVFADSSFSNNPFLGMPKTTEANKLILEEKKIMARLRGVQSLEGILDNANLSHGQKIDAFANAFIKVEPVFMHSNDSAIKQFLLEVSHILKAILSLGKHAEDRARKMQVDMTSFFKYSREKVFDEEVHQVLRNRTK